MKPSLKRALVYSTGILAGYGLGFFDGAVTNGPFFIGPLLVATVLAGIAIAKAGAWLVHRMRAHGGGSSPSGPDGPGVREPRPPGGRPPVLAASQSLG